MNFSFDKKKEIIRATYYVVETLQHLFIVNFYTLSFLDVLVARNLHEKHSVHSR